MPDTLSPRQVEAQPLTNYRDADCRSFVTGTYLATISTNGNVILLRNRALVKTVNDQLKNIAQIEYSRHRSVFNFMVNLIAGLIAYSYREKKPSLNLSLEKLAELPAAIF